MSFSSRIEQFVRSLIDEYSAETEQIWAQDRGGFGGYRFDPDYAEAAEDLEYFIRNGFERQPENTDRRRSTTEVARMPIAVRRAFRALEVPPGAGFAEVSRSYKRLITEYHPDRHAGDPERTEAATEVSKRLNLAYRIIRDYYIVIGLIDP